MTPGQNTRETLGRKALGVLLPGLGHLVGGAWQQGIGLVTLSLLTIRAAPECFRLVVHAGDHGQQGLPWLAIVSWVAVTAMLWHRAWRFWRPVPNRARPGIWRGLARRLVEHRVGVVGLFGVLLLALLALFAPLLAPHDPNAIDVGGLLAPPSWQFPMGTDGVRRDILSRVLHGARISLGIGVVAVAMATTVGTALGALAGYRGGSTDRLVMWLTDLFLSVPRLVLLLAIVGIWRNVGIRSLLVVVVVLGLTSWMGIARIVRAEILSLKEREFIYAARAQALGAGRIILWHLVPNVLPPVIVYGSLAVGSTILLEASLSFLGLGVPPPTATWGSLVHDGFDSLRSAWWITVFPGLMIVGAVMSFNLLGDGLRDILDPKQRETS